MLNIVLLEPEIPANTGNIGRTCVAAGAKLHLIEPMGFQINEKQVKRAGLDYWDKLDYTIYDSYPDFLEKNPGAKIYMATTKAKHIYSDVSFEEDCYIMFGKESAGIPEEILVENEETTIRIPMYGSTQAAGLSETQSDGASSSFSLARWHGIGNCKGNFLKKVLFFCNFFKC